MANEHYRIHHDSLLRQVTEYGAPEVVDILADQRYWRSNSPHDSAKYGARYLLDYARRLQREKNEDPNRRPWTMSVDTTNMWADVAKAVSFATAKRFLMSHPDYSKYTFWHRHEIKKSIDVLFRRDGATGLRLDTSTFKMLALPEDRDHKHGIPQLMAISKNGDIAHAITVIEGGYHNLNLVEEEERVGKIMNGYDCDYGKEVLQRSTDMSAETLVPTIVLLREDKPKIPGQTPYERTIPAGLLQMDKITFSVLERIVYG